MKRFLIIIIFILNNFILLQAEINDQQLLYNDYINLELKKYKRFPADGWKQIERGLRYDYDIRIDDRYLKNAQRYYLTKIIDRNYRNFENFARFAAAHPIEKHNLSFARD